MTVAPVGKGAKASGGVLSHFWKWITGGSKTVVKRELAKRTVKEIAEELGYFPSQAVKDALKGRLPLESIPAAERELAAKFYEQVARQVVSGPKELAARELNLARAKFLKKGGKPPVDIHGYEP